MPIPGWFKFSASGIGSLSVHGPLSRVPLPLLSYSPMSIRGLALADAVVAMQEKEAIELAPPSPGYYSHLFITPKVTSGWRSMIDLSRLNSWVDASHFHMETTQSVLQSLRLGDWMICLDLQDAYLQVPIHPSSRRYLRVCMGESVFQSRFLCFALSTAPQAFTRIMAPVSSIMHRHGFRILRYLDDWLVLGSSFQEIVRARDFLLWLRQQLGILINIPKSSLTPTQSLDHIELFRDDDSDCSFEGFPGPQACSEVVGSPSILSLRQPPASVCLATASGSNVLHVGSRFGCEVVHVIA